MKWLGRARATPPSSTNRTHLDRDSAEMAGQIETGRSKEIDVAPNLRQRTRLRLGRGGGGGEDRRGKGGELMGKKAETGVKQLRLRGQIHAQWGPEGKKQVGLKKRSCSSVLYENAEVTQQALKDSESSNFRCVVRPGVFVCQCECRCVSVCEF